MIGQPRVVLVGRTGCHLCDDARAVVAQVCQVLGVAWVEQDVDSEEGFPPSYSERVPVILVDGVEHAHFRVDPARLREALR